MSEKNLGKSTTNVNNLTVSDLISLRKFVELINERKIIAAKLRRNRTDDLLAQYEDIENQQQSLIDQMSEEGKKEAYAIRASISLYLGQPNSSGVM